MNKIKFAHLADLHLGAWREKRLTQLNFEAFKKAIDKIIFENIDFCIFSGDIFNNAMPPIELVTMVVNELMKLKKRNIPVYVIGGSHDYSSSGKSFLELLESAKVFINIAKYELTDKNEITLKLTKNDDLKVCLAGVLGKKNELDKQVYEKIKLSKLDNDYFNVFVFHSMINDFKPQTLKNIKAQMMKNNLPARFDYYAGGHIHTPMIGNFENATITYPGALFPNNFSELKKETPGFNLCEYDFELKKTKIERIELEVYSKIHIEIALNKENPIDAKNKIINEIDKNEIEGKIVLLEITGVVDGKIADIELNKIISQIYEKGALHVLKNSYKITSSLVDKIDVNIKDDTIELENEIIRANLQDSENLEHEFNLIKNLLKLELGKLDGEKNSQHEQRVIDAIEKILN